MIETGSIVRLWRAYLVARGRPSLALRPPAGRAARHFERLVDWLERQRVPYPEGYAAYLGHGRVPPRRWMEDDVRRRYLRRLDRYEPRPRARARARRFALDWLDERGLADDADDPLAVLAAHATPTELALALLDQRLPAVVAAAHPALRHRLADVDADLRRRLDDLVDWTRLMRENRP